MCSQFSVPNTTALDRLREQLMVNGQLPEREDDLTETAESTAARRNTTINDLNTHLGHRYQPTDPYHFIHPGRRTVFTDPESVYQQIFEHADLSKVSDRRGRTLSGEDKKEALLLLLEWFEACLNFPLREDDGLEPDTLANFRGFDKLLIDALPQMLVWDSEFGRMCMAGVAGKLEVEMDDAAFVEYRDGMGGDMAEVRWDGQDPNTIQTVQPIIGYPVVGQLVRKPEYGFKAPHYQTFNAAYVAYWQALEWQRQVLNEADQAMVTLARRVAGWMARKIKYEVVLPAEHHQGRVVYGDQQLYRAVKGILGEDWFEPLQDENILRYWSVYDAFPPGTEVAVNDRGLVTPIPRPAPTVMQPQAYGYAGDDGDDDSSIEGSDSDKENSDPEEYDRREEDSSDDGESSDEEEASSEDDSSEGDEDGEWVDDEGRVWTDEELEELMGPA